MQDKIEWYRRVYCCQVRHDDRGDLRRGLRAAQQRGDGAGAGVRDEEQAGVRPGNMVTIIVMYLHTCVPGDCELQPPREGDLLCGDHGVHGLGQRGQAPSHHQAATTPAPWIHTVRSAAYGYLMIQTFCHNFNLS